MILVNSVSSAMPIFFFMSIYVNPNWIREKIDSAGEISMVWSPEISFEIQSILLETCLSTVYSLGDRFVSLRSRGLGVLDLQTINLALMVKWWWILLSKTNGTLQVTIRTKYGQGWDPSLENQEIARTYRILGKT